MKVLVLGSGGREHALCWKLSQSKGLTKLYCAPGNAGTAQLAENVPLAAENVPAITQFATEHGVTHVVVGPEVPLCAGVADALRAKGISVFGPGQAAARLEGDKAFTKDLLVRHKLPTAKSQTFRDAQAAYAYSQKQPYPQVIKATGLAAGKGVIIALNPWQATLAIHDILEKGVFGAAGAELLIEEFLVGEEASLHVLISAGAYRILPLSQDHKRIGDGDTGPNTGGMGSYAPAPVFDEAGVTALESDLVKPLLAAFAQEGIDFRGVLYIGLMKTAAGALVLEFNVRFGDPETQVLLPLMRGDFLEITRAVAEGRLSELPAEAGTAEPGKSAAAVVMAAGGYPGNYQKGQKIGGIAEAEKAPQTQVFLAGVDAKKGVLQTSGGRVLAVTGSGASLREALDRAYAGVEHIQFSGAQFRRDIAARGLRLQPGA